MTYDVVTEEACATHSVPECATVVKHVPEQVKIFMVMKNTKVIRMRTKNRGKMFKILPRFAKQWRSRPATRSNSVLPTLRR